MRSFGAARCNTGQKEKGTFIELTSLPLQHLCHTTEVFHGSFLALPKWRCEYRFDSSAQAYKRAVPESGRTAQVMSGLCSTLLRLKLR